MTIQLSAGIANTTTLLSASQTTMGHKPNIPASSTPHTQESKTESEFIRVSSSIGRSASSGQLTRAEALDIYRRIAAFL